MAELSDEEKLIHILRLHKGLKDWVIKALIERGIECQETYGNDEKGDIIVIHPQDTRLVQQIVIEIHSRFNACENLTQQRRTQNNDNPHIEIKTQYLYGKEIQQILDLGTVIAIVSASHISQPAKLKLEQAGVVYAENVPTNEFFNA
jgi:hypothetical protein